MKTKTASKKLNAEEIRKDFPILKRKVNGKELVYLDNAATSQKPIQVIQAISNYYAEYNSNVHRSIHKLGEEATQKFEEAHKKVADFIGGAPEEIIFTKSTTESINLLAYSLGAKLKAGDEIVITQMEHHSNLVPWQQLAKRTGALLKFVKVTEDGKLDMGDFSEKITDNTKIVSVTHASNVLGTVNPVREMSGIAKEKGSLFIVDGAQSVPHLEVDVKELGCDFFAFSGHKMLGPTGVGVLYGKKEILEEMEPFLFGGEMIKEVSFKETKWNELPWKFEAGTPNIIQAIGLGVAIDYLKAVGIENIRAYETELTKYAFEKLSEIPEIKIYGPSYKERLGIVSFNLGDIHAHDVAAILDQDGIAIRGGHHCAMPLHSVLGINGSARTSFYLYNTKQEVDKLAESLKKVKKVFKV